MEFWVGQQWIYSAMSVWVLNGGREAQARRLGLGPRLGGAEIPEREPRALDVGNGHCFIGRPIAWMSLVDNRIQTCGLDVV